MPVTWRREWLRSAVQPPLKQYKHTSRPVGSSWIYVSIVLQSPSEIPTIESKHWVQSSRYTDWFGLGGRSSVKHVNTLLRGDQ